MRHSAPGESTRRRGGWILILTWVAVAARVCAQPESPAAVLSAADALTRFVLPPGFRIEVVAAEPLVQDPVAMAFDARGRLWVVEMPAYNAQLFQSSPTAAAPAPRSDALAGRVVVLTDTDGDGRLDRRVVFQDGLVLPRALAFFRDGVLIGDPPNLWWSRDTNGDDVADERIRIADDYGPSGADQVQRSANGLLWNRDNWLYSAFYQQRLRFRDGRWIREPMLALGQWGLTQDDAGRLFFNTSSSQLRASLLPPHYPARLGLNTWFHGLDHLVVTDQAVWPVRPTPGVNRGYRDGSLRTDQTLAAVTSAAAPLIYRGDNFPPRFAGTAFVPEPVANTIKHHLIAEVEGRLLSSPAFAQADFLSSTDERFRPVFLANGPDGALYVVDFYRGILEGRQFITPFLNEQIANRRLDAPHHGLGRIYRVDHEDGPRRQAPNFANATPGEIVKLLGDANGWTRDMAQRRSVESDDPRFTPALFTRYAESRSERDRLYAFWALEGRSALTPAFLREALQDASPHVRIAALRASEPYLRLPAGSELWKTLTERSGREEPIVVAQIALTLGQVGTPGAQDFVETLIPRAAEHPLLLSAILLALDGREEAILPRYLNSIRAAKTPTFGGQVFLRSLGGQILTRHERTPAAVFIDAILAPENPAWIRAALMQGLAEAKNRGGRAVAAELVPTNTLRRLAAAPDSWVQERAKELLQLRQANETRARRRAVVSPLTPAQKELYQAGEATYTLCAACHQANGQGLPNLAPALKGGRWATAESAELAVRIVLNGKEGSAGYPGAMIPLLNSLTDEQVAGVVTYIRRTWGNQASAVAPGDVARLRPEAARRSTAWTEAELEALATKSVRP